ncbi:hypothetical protein ACFR97_14385 [Haloplanus litoreus]|uniref:ABC transmembrane type-1 domain-containing protein n=1 Tax=Haloplanus litoreus TaxID=767515 RepID=A0ABD5ZXQ9_9EURY
MARPFGLFSKYDFFSVFVPGLATVFGFYMIIPKEIDIPVVSAIIPTLVLSFVFGQALHSLSVLVENLIGKVGFAATHRDQFYSRLNQDSDTTAKKVEEICESHIEDDGIDGELDFSSDSNDAVYSFVQSYVYIHDIGRSRTFQSIFAFSRSMTVFLFGLIPLYLTHQYLREVGVVARDPKYLVFFPNFGDFAQTVIPLAFMGGLVFWYSAYKYKSYFVEYLITDFISLNASDVETGDS